MYNGPDFMGCLKTPTLNTSWLEVQEPTATLAGRAKENFDRELSIDLLKEDYQRSINMLSPPPSPLFQNSPSPVEDNFSDLQSTFSQPISQLRSIAGKYNCIELREKTFDEATDGSFLFVTTSNVEKLQLLLRERGLEVQDMGKTRRPGVLVVLFKAHKFAKRAFTTQKEIGIRMIPPNLTNRYWFRNPSPEFPVLFETTRRLTVRTGKSSSNVTIGDFLMMNAKEGRGCLVLADQSKGRRMRVVGYIGKFMCTNGRIVEQKSMLKQEYIGWISIQNRMTKEKFVLRKSMNAIEDYVYDDGFRLVDPLLINGN